MKIKNTLIAFCIAMVGLCSPSSLQAQEISELFVNMPDSICPLLTKVNRADCIDFLASKMKAVIDNRFGKKSEMTELGSDFLRIQLSSSTSWQMKLLPMNDSIDVICTVATACAPICDSSIRFYSSEWKLLDSSKYLSLPKLSDFVQSSDTVCNHVYDEARRIADMLLVKADFNTENKELIFTFTTPDYLPEEVAGRLRPFVCDPLIYCWKDGVFIKKE